ncbi:MAG: FtsK/SpoIIIE domain-containing protein, partial [Chloroflexota bacterium]
MTIRAEKPQSNKPKRGLLNQPTTLSDEIGRKLDRLQDIGRDIGAFINGFQFNYDRQTGEVNINVRKKTRPLVELIPLLQFCDTIEPFESVIGWDGSQAPMMWSAASPSRHLLISGVAQSGKTGLLRSLLLTLVLGTKAAKLQLALIDGSCKGTPRYDHSELRLFSKLPHALNRPPVNMDEVCEVVEFLAKEADHRLKSSVQTPQILLVIDNLQDILPVAGSAFCRQLEHILDLGPQVGIGVILATNRPEDGRLQDLLAGMHMDRIVGKAESAGQAAFATGRPDSEAEFLDGSGEFLATLGSDGYHFQAAWVSDRELNRYLKHAGQRKPTLLAWDIPSDENDEMIMDDETSHLSNVYEARPGQPPQDKIQPEQIYTRLSPTWTDNEESFDELEEADLANFDPSEQQEPEEVQSPFNFRNEPASPLQGWAAMIEAPSANNGWTQDDFEDEEDFDEEDLYQIQEPHHIVHDAPIDNGYRLEDKSDEVVDDEMNFFGTDQDNSDFVDQADSEADDTEDLLLPSAEKLTRSERRSRPSSLQKRRQLSKTAKPKPKPSSTPEPITPNNDESFDIWQDDLEEDPTEPD